MITDVSRIRRLKEWEEVVGIPEKVDGNVIVFKDLGEVMVDDNKIILKEADVFDVFHNTSKNAFKEAFEIINFIKV